ncbi:HAD-IIA family hydrolase [Kiloniella laminariae]|uniref:HAD-IIA family hydrolase n=1 Tax=Kiloniella laminariae TaxID=454162 RepID=A0ABT4LJS5_9PROT|nr:HAD-IIA family hydrolase [Kiloniella laminariae]MCZ4281358.1 HAD-IIA family hydrolase [Kiloniella laminariae]
MQQISALLFDLDGTVYRGSDAIPGASDFIQSLKARNIPFLFVTNRGNRRPEQVARQLVEMGIPCTADDVLTSAQAVAMQLEKGTRAYCLGEEGLTSVLEEAGIRITEENAQAVIVSYDRGMNYEKLSKALRLIDGGARFIATNTDRLITVEDGILPEAGPLVAAVQAATGKEPEVFGKPERPIMDAALARLGKAASDCAIIGDNLFTDILAGHKSGMKSILILTGVATRAEGEAAQHKPTWIVENYQELEQLLFDE